MEFKGTPGPWMVAKGNLNKTGESLVVSPRNQIKYKQGWRVVCDISELENFDDEDLANAFLISKAPEMLEMLKTYLKDLDNVFPRNNFYMDRMKQIQQLINSATQIK